MKETLSDKICLMNSNPVIWGLDPEDVKKFIQRIREKLPSFIEENLDIKPSKKIILFGKLCDLIEEEVGDKLI